MVSSRLRLFFGLLLAGLLVLFAAGPGFTSKRSLDDHYEKHGAEFGKITKQQYLEMAQSLRDAKAGGDVLEARRADGVVTRYHRKNGWFIAYNANGRIRTFFKPNDGERYFRRQAARPAN